MKLFKKVACIVLAILAVASLSVPAFAASGINKAEQRVIDYVEDGARIGKNYYAPLQSYQNSMRNYFNRDGVNVTEAEADGILKFITQIYEKAHRYNSTATTINLKVLPYSWRKEILQAGIDAAKVIGLILVYNKSNNHVVISKPDGEILFDQEPIITIKKTGSNLTLTIATTSTVLVVIGAGVFSSVIAIRKRESAEG